MAESSDPQFRGEGTAAQSNLTDSNLAPQHPAPRSGPKPIQRLLSQDRVSRIVPASDSCTALTYSSDFVRDFIRSDWNYCTSKLSVATKGKILALDACFREANEWMDAQLAWSRDLTRRRVSLGYDRREVVVTHSLAGRLVRLLNQHDQLFANVLGAYMAGSIDDARKDGTLSAAARHIRAIHRLCIPDNNRFSRDGRLLDADS